MSITFTLPSGEQRTSSADTITIGSDAACQISLSDPRLRRKHAVIRKVAGKWLIEAIGDGKIKVNDGVSSQKCWLSQECHIHLTDEGPTIVFCPSTLSGSSLGPANYPNPGEASHAKESHFHPSMPSNQPSTALASGGKATNSLMLAGVAGGTVSLVLLLMCGMIGLATNRNRLDDDINSPSHVDLPINNWRNETNEPPVVPMAMQPVDTSSRSSPSGAAQPITWEDIAATYGIGNKVTDVRKVEEWKTYRGKRVRWSGQVTTIEEASGTLVLAVKMNHKTWFSDVLVRLRNGQRAVAATYNIGDSVTFDAALDKWESDGTIDLIDGVLIK